MQNKNKYPNYFDFEKSIKSGKLKPVYFILANDNYFLNKAGELLKNKLGNSPYNKDNFFIKYADETSIEEIFNLTSNFSSLFSQSKIIFVKKCEKYSRKVDELVKYSSNPDPDTTLVLSFDKDYVEEKKLNNTLSFYDFTSLSEREYFDWLKSEFIRNGCTIDEEAINLFSDYMPDNFDLVSNEIMKVSGYLEGTNEKRVTKEIILKLSGYEIEYTPSELMVNILSQNQKNALNILDYLLNKESLNEIFILNILINYFTDLMAVKNDNIKGLQNRDFYSKYKIWGEKISFIQRFHNRSKSLNFERIFEKLIETDQKLKTSMLDSKTLLFSLVEEITSF